ncbi:universal stress protein [Pseudomonas rubra]|uniref:Universal stress protein n=1 Tax=Pseudomonas rubra TaxID=2942627 RepID=A0ABT5PEL8_9PSED|nr:universal stress protein [Pseudomonas rubra]MDD1016703.1 universal stress protein [Pseudomonas rubra]MDD1040910.1 universal stress protein [Pseudomonas rubra]MDD1157536.1 universal stress protein [Pseudomonas rubra]
MSDYQRLLFIAPPLMQRTDAFDRAAALAKAKGIALHIVAFDYLEGLATAGLVNEQALAVMRQAYVEKHRQWLETQAVPLRRNGLTVTTEVVWVNNVLDEILTHLKEQPFAMVVKDIEHESRLMRAMFTTLDIRLLRECSVPLHFVDKASHAMPRKVLAAVDLSRPEDQYQGFNDRIINEALKLAMQCKAQVEILYAYDLTSMQTDAENLGRKSFLFGSNVAESLHEAQSDAFRELAERNGIDPESCHMIMGDPAKVLSIFCEAQGTDIVVMGRVHHRGLAKYIGSTVERVLYKMPSSVLVITPETPVV